MMSWFTSISLCLAVTTVAVHGGGLKILGGFVEEYDKSGDTHYGNSIKWGKSEADASSKVIELERMYCWSHIKSKRGACHHKIVVSTKDDPSEEHYQLVGSSLKIYGSGDVVLNEYYDNGITEVKPPIEEIFVANGDTWCGKTSSFKYGDLFFYVNKTTQPSITDDFSYVLLKQGHPDEHKDEVFLDFHEDTSAKIQYSAFSRYSNPWGTHGYSYMYIYRAPTTLIDAVPLTDEANSLSLTFQPMQTVVLRNEGSGVTSPDLPILGTSETVTTSSESRFMTSYDFSYSLEEEISFKIFSVDTSTSMSQSFTYHSEEEMKQTQKVESSTDITWPNECPSGFEITYTVVETSEEQELPVELMFKRAGVIWSEISSMKVTLRKIEISKDDCCIFASADETCGSEALNMCDGIPPPYHSGVTFDSVKRLRELQ